MRVRRDCQFDKVIVAFIGKIGPPFEVQNAKPAFGNERIKQELPLTCVQSGRTENLVTADNIAIFQQQRPGNTGYDAVFETSLYNA